MLRWVPYAFVRITFFFVLGILSAIYFGDFLAINTATLLFGGSVLLYFLSKVILTKRYFYSSSWIQGIFAFACIYLLGYLNLTIQNESLLENHLLNYKGITHYAGVVDRPAEEKENTYKYEVEVQSVKIDSSAWKTTKGRVYVYVDKQSDLLAYGDVIMVSGAPTEISPPMNPGEFNYKRFLTFRNVYHQDYLTDNFQVIGKDTPSKILALAFQIRKQASDILTQYIPTERENHIAQALILGVKDGIDRDTENAYAASGAMHVLAVSGLHVGIIYGIVLLLFKPFRKTKIRNVLLAIVSLAVLWCYALVTGFSPSVLRAVTMFSFIAVAQASGRNTNIYNTLAASGFILLLFNPYLIMSVGFQLSFLAVFGIVYIQPRIYNAVMVDNYLLDKVWAITAVSIAAQIATIPLTLLYFHQFPTFFLVSNLAVIPGAFIILCTGLILLAVSPIQSLGTLVGWLVQKVIFAVNFIVFTLSEIPYSQIVDIEITTLQSWLIIAGIMFILFLFERKRFKYLAYALVTAVLFASVEWQQTLDAENNRSIVIYRVNNHTAIDFIDGAQSHLFTDSVFSEDREGLLFHVRPNRLYAGIVNHKISPTLPQQDTATFNTLSWKGVNLLLLDKVDYDLEGLKSKPNFDYIVLTHKYNRDIQWIEENFEFEEIIFDGSLKWYLAEKLKEEADSLNVPYYSVFHKGATTIKI